ncbi:MAG: nitrilase-related carbon-nitrogen hydrolase, partial [Thermoplasmatota archaeon]
MAEIPVSRWDGPLNIAIIQPELALGDVDENLTRALELIDKASLEGPLDMIVLPEVFATGFPYDRLPVLCKRSGDIIEALSGEALRLKAHVMFTMVVEEDGRYYNRFFSIGPDGGVEATYDKTHLFSRAGEDRFFTPGNSLTAFSVKDAMVAPLICYEVRFPELARKQILGGADILVYPAQWPSFRIFQWEALLKGRAIENQCYVIGAGAYGPHGDSEMGGHSMVIAPFGDVLCRVDEGPGYARTTIGP